MSSVAIVSRQLLELLKNKPKLKELVKEKPEDIVLFNISEELKEIFNKFRTHLRKNYPEEYEKVK